MAIIIGFIFFVIGCLVLLRSIAEDIAKESHNGLTYDEWRKQHNDRYFRGIE